MVDKMNIEHKKDASKKKDTSSSNNEVSDSDRENAKKAHNDFVKGDYGACLTSLNKILNSRPTDPKVLMNKYLAEYYKTSLIKTDAFERNLQTICSKNGSTVDMETVPVTAENSVVLLNYCIIQYHTLQYRHAIRILLKMKNSLDTLEESIGIGVFLLLGECYLGLCDPVGTLDIVSQTEATFLPQPLPAHSSSPKRLQQEKESKSPEKVIPPSGKSSSNTSLNSNNGTEETKTSTNQELRNKLQIVRTRALIMMRSLKTAKRELDAMPAMTLMNISLKSKYDSLIGNHFVARNVLNQCGKVSVPTKCGPPMKLFYCNNLGAIHMAMSKPTLACMYLQKAVDEMNREFAKSEPQATGEKKSNREIHRLGLSIRPKLSHNLGVTLLHMGKPKLAFDFLLSACQIYHMNPRLWLRMAECCVMAHYQMLNPDDRVEDAKVEQKNFGHINKLVIKTNNYDVYPQGFKKVVDSAMPEPTLEFARMCLTNALLILPDNMKATSPTEGSSSSGTGPEFYITEPSAPISGSEVHSIKISCLTYSAYASLCLHDHISALHDAESLLTLKPNIPNINRILAHLYASEALICLGRIPEAIAHLEPGLVQDIKIPSLPNGVQSSSRTQNNSAWYLNNAASINHILKYNLSAAYAIRGDLEKSQTLIREVMHENANSPAQFVMLALYIQLKLGNVEAVKSIILSKVLT